MEGFFAGTPMRGGLLPDGWIRPIWAQEGLFCEFWWCFGGSWDVLVVFGDSCGGSRWLKSISATWRSDDPL